MAITVKENVNPEIMLEDQKKYWKNYHQDQKYHEMEKTQLREQSKISDKLARDRVTLENEERRAREPRVVQNFHY